MGDASILRPCDVEYSFRQMRGGAIIKQIVSFQHHFDPPPGGGFTAVLYEEDAQVPAVSVQAGDVLIWHIQILGMTDGGVVSAFIPNGDGPAAKGRYPSITVPR